MDIQWNLVNSKSLGLEILFRIISSSKNRDVGMKYIAPKNDIYPFFPINMVFWVCIKKKNDSETFLLCT